ncbi:MAG TPA: histidine phosphatase family protein [Ornithinibacter sp.]|nr:histidine phosphatase family protein [Ornithinibacter sp.]
MSPLVPGPAPRRVVVLRHGETDHNAARIWQGHLDTTLSDLGLEQADAAGPAIAALSPDRIVSSDLTRARLTAESVGRACGIPVTLDPRFREIDVGAWQGMGAAEVADRWPEVQAALARGEDVRRGEHGETVADVAERVGAALTEHLDALGPGECLVVSTHGASGRTLAAWLLGLDHDLAWRVLGALGNCHWAELVEGRAGWRIQTWNCSSGMASSAGSPPP